jgi:hypothetical protein
MVCFSARSMTAARWMAEAQNLVAEAQLSNTVCFILTSICSCMVCEVSFVTRRGLEGSLYLSLAISSVTFWRWSRDG